MGRSLLAAALVSLCAACSLDLDRLRAGAGEDAGGGTDAAVDAFVAQDDGGLDGGGVDVDAGPCECTGAGRWQPQPFLVGGTDVIGVALRDLDEDGDVDVVASRQGGPPSLLRVAPGACRRVDPIGLPSPEFLTGAPDTVAGIADLVGDEVLDVGIPDPDPISPELGVSVGAITGGRYSASAVSPISAATGASALWTAPAGDAGSVLGVVGGAGGVTVLTRGPGGAVDTFQRTAATPLHAAVQGLAGGGSLVAVAEGPAGIDVLTFDGAGTGRGPDALTPPASRGVLEVAIFDLNGDEVLDIVAITTGATPADTWLVAYFAASKGGGYDPPVDLGPTGIAHVAVGDVSGDTRSEIVMTAATSGNVRIGEWTGTMVRDLEGISIGGTARALAIGDVDGDGRQDIVLGYPRAGSGELTFLRRVCN